jgi:hypothetical protein
MLATLNEAREIARTSLDRWNELAASGASNAEDLAIAEAIAISAAVSVRQIEQYLSGKSREWLVSANDAPSAARMPETKQ